jgi:hypothetical protein
VLVLLLVLLFPNQKGIPLLTESPAPDGRFDTGLIGKNKESLPVTMPSEPGDYEYFCVLHPFLTGKVIISTTPPDTTTKGTGSGS